MRQDTKVYGYHNSLQKCISSIQTVFLQTSLNIHLFHQQSKKIEIMQIKNLKKLLLGLLVFSVVLASPSEIFGQTTITKGNFRTTNKDGSRTITVKNDRQDFRIEYEGDITISDDDKRITAISRNGYIEIRKTRFGKRRRLFIESEGGKLTHRYYIGSREVPFDPDGKSWLAEVLPDIVRTTTIAAESRVDRFYKKGGAKEVMYEVEAISSDYVKAAYVKLLLKKKLSNKDLVSVIKTIGNEIDSDYYLSQILKTNQKAFLATQETKSAYIKAAKSLDSDHYTTQIVKAVISDSDINDSDMNSLLDITEGIDSDHYKSQILLSLMKTRKLNKDNMNTIMRLSRDIDSDHYRTQILRKALKKEGMSSENYQIFLNSLSEIDSDHYTTEVIKDLMVDNMKSADLSKLLDIVNKNIDSDHYATNIYKKLAKNNNITETQLIQLMESASQNIDSDHYLSTILIAYVSKVKKSSQKVKDAYTKAAKSMNSDTYFGRAMKALY